MAGLSYSNLELGSDQPRQIFQPGDLVNAKSVADKYASELQGRTLLNSNTVRGMIKSFQEDPRNFLQKHPGKVKLSFVDGHSNVLETSPTASLIYAYPTEEEGKFIVLPYGNFTDQIQKKTPLFEKMFNAANGINHGKLGIVEPAIVEKRGAEYYIYRKGTVNGTA